LFQRILRSISGYLTISLVVSVTAPVPLSANPTPVLQKQGSQRGFLLLRSADGVIIAVGDQVNVVRGNSVHSRLIFHFRDGSIDEEVTVFRQASTFQLVRDHHVQKGPSFPQPLDVTIEMKSGQVTWHDLKNGKDEVKTEHMDLPPDLSNGLMSLIVQNFPAKATEMKVSYLAGGSKPRIVRLIVKPDGQRVFRLGGSSRRANQFKVHIEIGGVAGVIAPVVGKQMPDIEMWVSDGEVPTFLRMEGPLYEQGPIWTMELTVPTWQPAASSK
jgi:hypothetical protein